MSANRASTARARPRRQRNLCPVHQPADSFLPRRGLAIALETSTVMPVPLLDWPANLFLDVHPVTDDDWSVIGLSVVGASLAPGHGSRPDHAGVGS
jgi:hypothetical protein